VALPLRPCGGPLRVRRHLIIAVGISTYCPSRYVSPFIRGNAPAPPLERGGTRAETATPFRPDRGRRGLSLGTLGAVLASAEDDDIATVAVFVGNAHIDCFGCRVSNGTATLPASTPHG
jgi:hypothetical protein